MSRLVSYMLWYSVVCLDMLVAERIDILSITSVGRKVQLYQVLGHPN